MSQNDGILKAGDLLNNTYEIEKLVGQGGTGEVYRARNIISNRKFAIKILKQEFANNETFINLMRRESDVLHEVRDDAVVRYNELLRSELNGGFVFLVMEYISGPQLAEIAKERGSIDAESLLMIAKRMGQGLKAAHDKKAFHRDMSPDNIILPDGDMSKAKLIDFGIARDLNENAQTVVGGGFAGKYQYAAPEQLDGNVDARSDLYSLGMTLLRVYRGKPIEVGSTLMEIAKSKSERPDTRDVPGKLGMLISRLVEPRPEDRFQSADEMLAFLKDQPDGGPTAPALDEATILAPQTLARRQSQPSTLPPGFGDATKMPPEPGTNTGGSGAKWLVLLLFLAGIGGGGWYFGMGPGKAGGPVQSYPAASPYVMELFFAGNNSALEAKGNVADPAAASALHTALSVGFGMSPQSNFQGASGAPIEGWEDAVTSLALTAKPLAWWRLEISDTAVILTGEAGDDALASAVIAAMRQKTVALGFSLQSEITVPVMALELALLNQELQTYQSCGPLRVTGGDGFTLGPRDRVTVSGIIARESDVEVIDLVLQELLAGRGIDYNVAVLNEAVCLIEGMLPLPVSSGLEIVFSYGNRSGEAQNGVFRTGENPIIDLAFPATQTGYLYGFYVEAEGQVYHLLPHKDRPNNAVQEIGTVQDGIRTVQLSFASEEATTEKLGFTVIEPYGTGIIVAVISETPLFDGLRPRAESVQAFREALAKAQPIIQNGQTLISSRYLVTER